MEKDEREFLVIDIETVPDETVYPAPAVEPGTERPFPPLWAHRPIVIGAMLLGSDLSFRRLGVVGEDKDEPGLLAAFASYVDRDRHNLVTFNGRGFDLPVICLRCLRHGVAMPFYYQDRSYRYRYSPDGHIDLLDEITDHGASRDKVGLDTVARLIGLPGKVGVDGSQVEGLFKAGRIADVRRYCLSDVVQTAFVFLRFRLLQGFLDRDAYRRTAAALLDAVAGDERVKEIAGQVDRRRLLLDDAP